MNAIIATPGQIIVRAVDVGFGYVKFTLHHREITEPIACENFPSHSPLSSDKGLAQALSGIKSRDTVAIKVDGIEYEVGKQVTLALGVNDESVVLGRNFCKSDAYLARLRGALFYMRGNDKNGIQYTPDTIELLVVGLPVNTYRDKELAKHLQNRVTGLHCLPDGRSVTVERALVLPQPMGAFFQHAIKNSLLSSIKHQVSLIMDPGYFTFDWLMSSGMTPLDVRSDAVNRGMSAIFKIMAREINKQENLEMEESILTRMLDEHYRSGIPFSPFNVEVNLSNYECYGTPVVNEAVASMAAMVGSGGDIHNMLLAGGGAKFYHEAIQNKFPRHNVIYMEEPLYCNVRGFQMAGEQTVLAQRVKDRKVSTAALNKHG
jgi:plasmid segregation protein ParM